MSKLFWKIFLTFWVTTVLVELATVWITVDLSEHELQPVLATQNNEFIAKTTQAVTILTSKGLPALKQWLANERNSNTMENVYIISQGNDVLSGRPLPQNIETLIQKDYADQALINHSPSIKHILTLHTVAPDGEEFYVVTTFAHPSFFSYLLAPQRVAFGIIISGIICFLLAGYFTSPLIRLRRSTKTLQLGGYDSDSLRRLCKRKDEFGALAVDFDQMMLRVKHLLQTQQQLLRDVSHELRSPLARMSVALELARKKIKNSSSLELDRIAREIERLEMLISELMVFVRMESNTNSGLDSHICVHRILGQVVHDANYEMLTRNAKITLSCDKDLQVRGDARLLQRAVENIARNACYYSPENSVINITGIKKDEHIEISIEDSGPGIPQNMLDNIFQPFVRVSSARESDTGGSGIGLAIAKRVIDLHKGHIVASNKTIGKGLIVTITLPLPDLAASSPVT